MYIITVIPLVRSRHLEKLSYFTTEEVPIGAVVSVPIRSKSAHAIVVESRPAVDLKAEIKNATFQIRKLTKVKASLFFPANFVSSCQRLAAYYATTIGAIIHAVVSESILGNIGKIPAALPLQTSFNIGLSETLTPIGTAARRSHTIYAVQGDDDDRASSWRSLIRQEFARKKSVIIYAPTADEAQNTFARLEKGIEGYIFLVHNGLTAKKVAETWKTIADTDHPVVIVATGTFCLWPRSDIESVIIERENARGWIQERAPYLDLRQALQFMAATERQTLYRADSLLGTETLHRVEAHEIAEGSPFKWRSISTARDSLIDMRTKKEERRAIRTESQADKVESNQTQTEKAAFKVISSELEALIRRNHEENTHLFLLTVRRGISPTTVCGDCQALVTCRECQAPVVLHSSTETGRNFFMCHVCGARRSADEVCTICGSWKLVPLGIGIERVAADIHALFPDIDVFQIDADTVKTDKQLNEIMAKFRARPGSILLGTEMTLVHMTEKVEHAAIVSLDSLLALPDYRIQEKIMYTLIRVRSMATRSILVQTRRPEERVFEYGLKGNLSDFYRLTLGERKQFHYPPYSRLIKITIEGKKEEIVAGMAEVKKVLDPREIDVFPAFTGSGRGRLTIHGLLKVEPHAWPDAELSGLLKSLPPGVAVRVDPESLL